MNHIQISFTRVSQTSILLRIINEIADLRFLTLVISQKAFEIADFSDFEETFWSECSERNERRGAESRAEAGVPLGVAVAKDVATRSE